MPDALSDQQQWLQKLIAKHSPKPRKREETNLSTRLQALAKHYRSRLWRNTVGRLQDKRGTWVTYGLGVGSSDLIGYRVVLVTPEMVGQKIAQFACVEVKKPGRDTTDPEHRRRQEQWIAAVVADGGVGGIVRSEEEFMALLQVNE